MKFLEPSAYFLPSLKFLQKRRLIATTIYVSVYYLLFAAFATSLIDAQLHHSSSYYSDQGFVITFDLFMLAGVGVLLHIRRLTLAFNTKRHALRAGITVPQYELDISPVEASVLIDAADAGEMGLLVINAIQAKGGLRAWRSPDGRINLQQLESGSNTTYYEQVFISWLFQSSHSVTLTDHQLQNHQAVKAMQQVIYQHMVSRGYYAKMSWWQQMIYQYAITATIVFAYASYSIIVLLMALQFIGPLFFGPIPLTPTTYDAQFILVLTWAAILLITPLLLLLFGAYSKKGSEAFRTTYGLYWFLKVALQSRLKDPGYLSKTDFAQYGDYAKAFGLRVEK